MINAAQMMEGWLDRRPPKLRSISIGIIGAGAVVHEQHLPGFQAVEGCRVQALSGRDPSRAEQLGKAHGVAHRYSDWKRMIDNGSLDAVSIATPPADHYEMAVYCLQAGLHVLVEKPIVTSLPELDSLLSIAEKTGRWLLVRQNFRFFRSVHWARQCVKAGSFGNGIKMDLAFGHSGPRQKWHFEKARGGGGAFMDLGIHLVDLARYVLDDEAAAVHLVHSRRRSFSEVEDEALAILEMRKGPLATLRTSWNGGPCEGHFTLAGERGMARIEFCPHDRVDWKTSRLPEGSPRTVAPHPEGIDAFHHFIACIRGIREPIIAADDNARSLRTVLKGYEASR